MIRLGLFTTLFITFAALSAQNPGIESIDSAISHAKKIYYAAPDSSMVLGKEILRSSEKIEYENGRLEGLRLIGNSHFLMGRLDSAAYYMLRLLDQAYEVNNIGMQADVMIDIGQTYDKIGLHALALDYFKQAHEIRLKTGEPERLSITFINLAYHFYLRDKLDTALYYYKKTQAILDTIPLTYTKPFLYNELGGLYLKQGKINLAREYIQKAINLNVQLNNNWDLSYNYVILANLELREGNIQEAERHAQKALEISEKSNISLENDLIYKILSEVKSKQGFHKKALEYLDKSYKYSDSLEMALTDQKILALNHYKREKENQIANLQLKNENLAQNARLANQNYILVSIAFALIVTLIAIGVLFYQNKKLNLAQKKIKDQNTDLKELNTIKSKLFSIITHDIRNPLSNINGMLQLARDGHISNEDFSQYAGSLVDQTDRLKSLTETLISWSKSQQKGLSASFEEIDLNKLIRQSLQYVDYMAENKFVEMVYQPVKLKNIKADPNMMMLILNNLLTNAIKFTQMGGKVEVKVEEKSKTTLVKIKDTGIGIDPNLMEELSKGNVVTQPGTENEKGSGIGLMLTLDLLALNGGKLEAEINKDGGSTFIVTLPNS